MADTGGVDRDELAQLLRRARARLAPTAVGLPTGSRRRVAGLRREEVAHLAGVSVDYVVRLEQGRGPHPSDQVLAALTRALRLDCDDRDQLYRLAGSVPPGPGRIDLTVRPSVLRLLDRLADLPAIVLSAKADILAWNPMATALLGDFSQWPAHQRNVTWQRFLGEPGRVSLPPDEDERTGRQAVATLRSALTRYPTDASVRALVAELRARSPRFATYWAEGGAGPWRLGSKTIVHPELGAITCECDTLLLPDTDQAMVVYSAAPDSDAASALALLRVTGLQEFART